MKAGFQGLPIGSEMAVSAATSTKALNDLGMTGVGASYPSRNPTRTTDSGRELPLCPSVRAIHKWTLGRRRLPSRLDVDSSLPGGNFPFLVSSAFNPLSLQYNFKASLAYRRGFGAATDGRPNAKRCMAGKQRSVNVRRTVGTLNSRLER